MSALRDVVPAGAVLVGEQLLAGVVPVEQGAHDLAHARVDDRLHPLLAALGGVVEDDQVAGDRHVLAAHGGQPEGAVLLGVRLATDPEEAEVEQPERGGQHALLGEAALPRGARRPGPRAAAAGGRTVSTRSCFSASRWSAPLVVVAVLPATGGVGAERLDVPAGVRADPHVRPGGRDHEVGDALEDSTGR